MLFIDYNLVTKWYARVLANAELGVFLRQLLVLYAYFFLLGILIYAKFFFSADASQTP